MIYLQRARWNRFVRFGNNADDQTKGISANRSKSNPSFCLASAIHESEKAFLPENEESCHKFEVRANIFHTLCWCADPNQMTLEHSSYTKEKYALYLTYQEQIHHDHDNTPTTFKRFLVNTPLIVSRG